MCILASAHSYEHIISKIGISRGCGGNGFYWGYIGIMSKAGRTHIAIEILICKMGLILNYEDFEDLNFFFLIFNRKFHKMD